MLNLLVLILFILTCPFIANAVEQANGAPGMVIHADIMTHDSVTGLIKAKGKVDISWQGMTVTADGATYDSNKQVLTANGNIRINKAGDSLSGDSLELDTTSGRAELVNGHIFMTKGNIIADGKMITKIGDDDYLLKNGGFTTCDASVPSWKFSASELDVTIEEYATGKNVIFYVKDIPVFYFPYIVLPVKRERQSGFLFPKLGNSTKRGQFVDVPYYWAISPSQEAVINLDLQTKRGIGTGVDYRYLRNRNSEGSLGGYLINDEIENRVRGQFFQKHYEQLSNNLSFVSSINVTSDKSYLKDYGEKSGDYNRQYNDSRISVTKHWDHWLTNAQTIYTQNYDTSLNQNSPPQVIPALSIYGVKEQIPGIPGMYLDLDLGATNFYIQHGLYGQRLIAEPRVTSAHQLWSGKLNLSIFAGSQLRAYKTDGGEPGSSTDIHVAIPRAGAQISSSFSRIYNTSLMDIQRMRHEIVPEFSYLYSGERDQDSLPLYDKSDRVNAQDRLAFSISSHLGGRLAKEGDAEYRDLMTVRAMQTYNLSHDHQTDLFSLIETDGKWGDLILESETWPNRQLRILSDIRYSHQDQKISSTATGAELNDLRGNTARISYRNVRQELEYLEAGATVALTRPFFLNYTTRYSFDKKDFLESFYTVEYRHQCWSVIAGYRERPDDKSWTINFNLAGLFENNQKSGTKNTK